MTDQTKPVGRIDDRGNYSGSTSDAPFNVYTADQLQAARLEGIEAGIEAAGRLCDKLADNEPTGYVGDKLAIATMRVCAAYVHALALDPETVLKEYGK